jgi:hypothetical protein
MTLKTIKSWLPGILRQVVLAVAATGILAALAWVSLDLFIVVLALVVTIYILTVFWSAKYRVDDSPQKDMYICPTHGPMPIGTTIVLFESMDYEVDGRVQRGPVRVCSRCFEKSIRVAKENVIKGQR